MAEITRFQLNEIKREIWFQITRIERDLAMSVRKPPGMLKSRRRLLLLLSILNHFDQDGVLELKENTEVTGYADGAGASVDSESTTRTDSERSR